VIEEREVHSEKVFSLMKYTEEGMQIAISLEQYSKTPSSIYITDEGMMMEVREVHLEKALLSIAVTVVGIKTDRMVEHP